ncbi:MAG: DUF2764 family protein [Spirochaetota bacterium]
MLSDARFDGNTGYAYSVARVRAMETRLLNEGDINTLLSASPERFFSHLIEIAGITGSHSSSPDVVLQELEESFTATLYTVKSLILEDEPKRLVSLKYDYELLKLIAREQKGWQVEASENIWKRSNYDYAVLKELLEAGKAGDTGEVMLRTYRSIMAEGELTRHQIDRSCDYAYYSEAFKLLQDYSNQFITEYFIREVDIRNILTALRLKAREVNRGEYRQRFIPFGSIDLSYLLESFDLNLDGFAQSIAFSPFAKSLLRVEKKENLEDQITQLEGVLKGEQIKYLKDSVFITFGIEPVLAYLFLKERELIALRTILKGRESGLGAEEIQPYVRELYG